MADAKRRILIVDDDPDFRFQQRVQLERAGFDVTEAESHAKARKLLPNSRFDIVMVDLMMEEMDAGFTLCHEIKRQFPSLPIIMVTAVASEAGLEFEATTGEERSWIKADAMLAKPIRFEQLKRELDRLLKG